MLKTPFTPKGVTRSVGDFVQLNQYERSPLRLSIKEYIDLLIYLYILYTTEHNTKYMVWKMHDYIEEIREKLKEINPYKVVLFGSVSKGYENEESDIDLLVILDSDRVSQNYEEKMENKLLVRRSIYEISKKIPIDLLVYTKKEFEIIKENKNSFFKEIDASGKTIYEKAS